jgi:hypothetical protein
MATMTEQQFVAWHVDVSVCCDKCWPPVALATASFEAPVPPASFDTREAWFGAGGPPGWQLELLMRLGTNFVRARERSHERSRRNAERRGGKLAPLRRRPSRETPAELPPGPGGERPRGVTLRCRRCKRTRNHSLRRIYRLAEAAVLAGEDRIYP